MRIKVYSDLHLDCHEDDGVAFIRRNIEKDVNSDGFICAGDVSNFYGLEERLNRLCEAAGQRPILFVAGNHEFYLANRELTRELLTSTVLKYKNFHWLDQKVITLGGQRFVGATMWFPQRAYYDPVVGDAWNLLYDSKFSDFRYITSLSKWVYAENLETQEFFRNAIKRGDVVITHHAPSTLSVTQKWLNDKCNRYFVCDMTDVILNQNPKYWIHGHMHQSLDYTLGDCRVICNPYGTRDVDLNKDWDKNLVIEV